MWFINAVHGNSDIASYMLLMLQEENVAVLKCYVYTIFQILEGILCDYSSSGVMVLIFVFFVVVAEER